MADVDPGLRREDEVVCDSRSVPPALSIVFFTTASGAGFALLFLIGIGVPLGLLPAARWFSVAGLLTAFVLAAGGLGSSVFPLRPPQPALPALSPRRSSRLPRRCRLPVVAV